MKRYHFSSFLTTIIFIVVFCLFQADAQFSVSTDRRYLLKSGQPFFWLGDTGWELFHRLSREDADSYLKRRSEQGFTVIQAVVLAELDGLHTGNAYGEKPLINDDPAMPNERYFEHVDYIIERAAVYNLTIGLLPTWGDKVFKNKWGAGPEIFNEKNADVFGGWLASRYKSKNNIIWILGGDRNPRDEKDISVWRSMGKAIKRATNGKAMISYHPQPNQAGSAEWFHNEDWLDFNMFQTGHCRDVAVYDRIREVYNLQPVKPVMDAEPIYEGHPVCFNVKDLGTSNAYDVRKAAYLDLFSGAFGHTYGCHDIWQMYSDKHEPVNGPHLFWHQALELPGANQMKFVRRLLESRPVNGRVPDQSLILENNYAAAERIQAARGAGYMFFYTAVGKPFTVQPGKITGKKLQGHWYNPRDGKYSDAGAWDNTTQKKFTPPSVGYGQDWILVVDDIEMGYTLPR